MRLQQRNTSALRCSIIEGTEGAHPAGRGTSNPPRYLPPVVYIVARSLLYFSHTANVKPYIYSVPRGSVRSLAGCVVGFANVVFRVLFLILFAMRGF